MTDADRTARRPRVGTLAWTRQTRGIMSARDRIDFVGQALIYGLAMLPAELRRVMGIRRRRLAQLDPAVIAPPDSAVAREAAALIEQGAPPMIANHGHRTYAFGALLAAHDGLRFDAEVVYVASLLHDLYFTAPNVDREPHCFTLPAADRTTALLSEAGWEAARRDLAAEAITLHLNVRPPRDSPEAYAVYAGARLDVQGYRYDEVAPSAFDAVLERHPRLDLKRASAPMFRDQSAANRGSRVDFYTRYLAVNWFIKRAPFAE